MKNFLIIKISKKLANNNFFNQQIIWLKKEKAIKFLSKISYVAQVEHLFFLIK